MYQFRSLQLINMPYERLDSDQGQAPVPPLLTVTSNNTSAAPVVLYSTPDTSHEQYEGRRSMTLGIIQVVGGITSIICQIVLIAIKSVAMFIGAGLWVGIPVSCGIVCVEGYL